MELFSSAGFMIWYKLSFEKSPPDGGAGGGLLAAVKSLVGIGMPVSVSNDVLSGQFIVDSDITLTMLAGTDVSTFEITVKNLPKETVDTLKDAKNDADKAEAAAKQSIADNQKDSSKPLKPFLPLLVKIYLGYFDNLPRFTSPDPVMEGAILKISSDFDPSGVMKTTISGQELTGYKLINTPPVKIGLQSNATVEQFLKAVPLPDGVTLDKKQGLSEPLAPFTLTAKNSLDALNRLVKNQSRKPKWPIVVRDKKVFVKDAVGAGDPIDELSEDRNVVEQKDGQGVDKGAASGAAATTAGGAGGGGSAGKARSQSITVIGNPDLRVGQIVKLGGDQPSMWRIEYLVHKFSCIPAAGGSGGSGSGSTSTGGGGAGGGGAGGGGAGGGGAAGGGGGSSGASAIATGTNGYTCDLIVSDAKAGEVAQVAVGAKGVVHRLLDLADDAQQKPIDVGEIAEYAPGSDKKHLATLNYGQSASSGQGDKSAGGGQPQPDELPSPSVTSPIDPALQLFDKPIASPFAFDKCGLIVPIYPKMRALLAHNQSLTNDAIITGFLWAQKPPFTPPENQAGDYWLCLPTGLTDGVPSGKGANDLTDKSGQRVIQVKGLQILVGDGKLADVGKRPPVPSDLDQSIIVEHESGTKITIAKDGSVSVETAGKKLSLTNGSVTLALDGSSVGVS